MNKVLLYGGTGQSKMMKAIIDEMSHYRVCAVIDDTEGLKKPFDVESFVSGKNAYERWKEQTPDYKNYYFAVTIGNPHGHIRKQFYQQLESDGLTVLDCLHENSEINSSKLGKGLQIHSKAIINPLSSVGNYCIINTMALLEHDSIMGDGAELGPGSVVCGEVNIGENTWIGAGATVLPGLRIGKNCIIGAGAVVTKDIPDNEVWIGNPAKFMRKNGK